VLVEQLGWQLQAFTNSELDPLDRSDMLYVATRVQLGKISGCARLLPTTQPYLLGDFFPQLLNGITPPNSQDVWELSLFEAVAFNAKKSWASGQFSSPAAKALLHEAIAVAAT
jgi:acyl homoserine lactone synthase